MNSQVESVYKFKYVLANIYYIWQLLKSIYENKFDSNSKNVKITTLEDGVCRAAPL